MGAGGSDLLGRFVEQQRDASNIAAFAAADDGQIEAAPEFEISGNQTSGSSSRIKAKIIKRAAAIVKCQANAGVVLRDGDIAPPVTVEIRRHNRDRLSTNRKVHCRSEGASAGADKFAYVAAREVSRHQVEDTIAV